MVAVFWERLPFQRAKQPVVEGEGPIAPLPPGFLRRYLTSVGAPAVFVAGGACSPIYYGLSLTHPAVALGALGGCALYLLTAKVYKTFMKIAPEIPPISAMDELNLSSIEREIPKLEARLAELQKERPNLKPDSFVALLASMEQQADFLRRLEIFKDVLHTTFHEFKTWLCPDEVDPDHPGDAADGQEAFVSVEAILVQLSSFPIANRIAQIDQAIKRMQEAYLQLKAECLETPEIVDVFAREISALSDGAILPFGSTIVRNFKVAFSTWQEETARESIENKEDALLTLCQRLKVSLTSLALEPERSRCEHEQFVWCHNLSAHHHFRLCLFAFIDKQNQMPRYVLSEPVQEEQENPAPTERPLVMDFSPPEIVFVADSKITDLNSIRARKAYLSQCSAYLALKEAIIAAKDPYQGRSFAGCDRTMFPQEYRGYVTDPFSHPCNQVLGQLYLGNYLDFLKTTGIKGLRHPTHNPQRFHTVVSLTELPDIFYEFQDLTRLIQNPAFESLLQEGFQQNRVRWLNAGVGSYDLKGSVHGWYAMMANCSQHFSSEPSISHEKDLLGLERLAIKQLRIHNKMVTESAIDDLVSVWLEEKALQILAQDKRTWCQPLFATFDEAVFGEQRLLIHCQAGISRSASIVIAYLMDRFAVTAEQARAYLRTKRACVDPKFMDELSRDFGQP